MHGGDFLQPGLRVGLVNHSFTFPPLHYWKTGASRTSEALGRRIWLGRLVRSASTIRCSSLPRHDLLAVGIIHRRLGQVVVVIISKSRWTVEGFESVDASGEGDRTSSSFRFLPRDVLSLIIPGRLRRGRPKRVEVVERAAVCEATTTLPPPPPPVQKPPKPSKGLVAPKPRSLACNTCGGAFPDAAAHRAHFKSDWHRFNLARKLKQQPPVDEKTFEEEQAIM